MTHPLRTVVAAVLGSVGLAISAHAPLHAQGTDQVLHSARPKGRPAVVAWVDDAQGPHYSAQVSQQYEQAFANSQWQLLANGQLQIKTGDKTLLVAPYLPTSQAQTVFFVHRRNANSSVDGLIFRDVENPAQSSAQLFVSTMSNDGKSFLTLWIVTPIEFDAQQGGNSGGGFGGFGLQNALSAPAQAQDTAQVLHSARTKGRPNVIVWVDDAQGSRYDAPASQELSKALADSQWQLLSNGELQVSANGEVLITEPYLANRDQSVLQLFFVHRWSPRGSANGFIARRPDALSDGNAELFRSIVAADGKSVRTIWIFAGLDFQTQEDGGTGGDLGDFGGFGG